MDRLVTTFPTMFGHYRLLRRLGTGGMGEVYLAEDTAFRNRKTAIKIPLKRLDAVAEARFKRETDALRKLRHSHICELYDAGTIDGSSYLAMEYIEGHGLAEQIGKGRRWPAEEAVSIIVKLASALQHAHESGVIHRDIKPSNVMFWASGEPVLMDFGLAKLTGDPTVTQANGMFGTPAYMPLEQARGDLKNIGPHSDVFSLGVVLFEMLSGQRAMSGESTMEVLFKLLNEPSPHLKFLVPEIDSQLADVCAKAMAKKWQERYRTMSEFSTALSACKVAVPEPVFKHSLEDVLVDEVIVELLPFIAGDADAPPRAIPIAETRPYQREQCPHCSRNIKFPANALGKRAKCPSCRGLFVISAQGGHAVLAVPAKALSKQQAIPPVEVARPDETESTPVTVNSRRPKTHRPWLMVGLSSLCVVGVSLLAVSNLGYTDTHTRFGHGAAAENEQPQIESKVELANPSTSVPSIEVGNPTTPSPKPKPATTDRTTISQKHDSQNSEPKPTYSEARREDATRQQASPSTPQPKTPTLARKDELEEQTEEFEWKGVVKRSRIVTKLKLGGEIVEFVKVPKGSFMMGSPPTDTDARENEKPQHRVTFTYDLWVAKYPITKAQFAAFVNMNRLITESECDEIGGMGYNQSLARFEKSKRYSWRETGWPQTDRHPVVNVNWIEANAFCQWASLESRRPIRLLSEAEHEYANRGGETTTYIQGDHVFWTQGYANIADQSIQTKIQLKQTAYFDDSEPFSSPVGKYKPNGFGLYDMTGNVWCWCEDVYSEKGYAAGDVIDPKPFTDTVQQYRLCRGGSYSADPRACRAAARTRAEPSWLGCTMGFRIAFRLE